MRHTTQATYDALLESGKQEFLAHGFEKASLRAICKNAGVTTGAFYAQFDKKEDLFNALVEPMLARFAVFYDSMMAREMADIDTSEDNEVSSIRFIAQNKDEFKLLFDCSQGTAYEGYRDELMEKRIYPSYQEFYDTYAGQPVDPAIVRITAQMRFGQYMDIVYGDHSPEEQHKLIRYFSASAQAGFHRLIELIRAEQESTS